jgi:hypothetical protein
MAPFEMLYGHRCQTSLHSNDTRERKVFDLTYCKKPKTSSYGERELTDCAFKTEEL